MNDNSVTLEEILLIKSWHTFPIKHYKSIVQKSAITTILDVQPVNICTGLCPGWCHRDYNYTKTSYRIMTNE